MSDQDPMALDEVSQGRIFLERRGYRQRRFIDAARLMPFVGLLLWLVPLVWPDATDEGVVKTSNATLYIFAIWIGLISLGAYLARRMTPGDDPSDQSEDAMIDSADAENLQLKVKS